MNKRSLSTPLALILVLIFASGCATSLTNSSPARTMKVGEGMANTSYQFDIHTQSFTGIYRAGEAALNQVQNTPEGENISEETLRALLDAALMWKLFPLGGGPEVMGRVGIYDDLLEGMDLGFRYNGSVLKGDLRLQLWANADDSAAVSAQFGYGHHASIITRALEWAMLTEFKRRDFDFQINLGYEAGDWGKFYVSPRYILSRISTEASLSPAVRDRLPEEYRDWDPSQYFPDSNLHYVGVNWGAMVGYRYAFVTMDLSIFRTIFHPTVLGSERDYSGWVLSPTLGLTLMWR